MTLAHDASPIIEIADVTKVYKTYSRPSQKMLELLSPAHKQFGHETRALDGVSLSLMPGSKLGIVGDNGSGKSTLLKVLCGVLTPTTGSVRVRGRISALLELGAGFNPELSGYENIRQFCLLHGMQRDEIEKALPEIIQFSELQESIDHPVKTYSSGMAVRLGFSCAVYVKPDILIVDEALSVGDAYFQNKCLGKIKSLLDEGVTFIYVTHSADSVRNLCDQGIWLESGKIRLQGTAKDVSAAYQTEVFRKMSHAGLQRVTSVSSGQQVNQVELARRHQVFAERVGPLRTGSGDAQIQDIVLLDEDGVESDSIPFSSPIRVRVYYLVKAVIDQDISIALGITDMSGRQLVHFNAAAEGVYLPKQVSEQLRYIDFSFVCPLCPGEYGLTAGVAHFLESPVNKGQLTLGGVVDHCVGGARFKVEYPQAGYNLWGVTYAPCVMADHAVD